ncbi:MAG: hypothetical protein AB1632_02090 [Nitrospirota bacterium]
MDRANTKGSAPADQIPSDIARHIEEIFQDHINELGIVIDISVKVKEKIRSIDSFIQKNTSVVCNKCKKVCCINQHSYYNCEDLVYIYALGLKPREYEQNDDSGPCRFLSCEGCCLERAIRPSGCNWYFCDSLYATMEQTPRREYNDFDESMLELAELWMELINEFLRTYRKITGYEIKFAHLVCSSNRKADSSDRVH